MMNPIRLSFLIVILLLLAAWIVTHPLPRPTQPENTRFVKIDAEGKAMGAWKGPWRCVEDRDTGLLWEVKSYLEADLQDRRCSFSWFDGQTGVQKGGNCFGDYPLSDIQNLIDHLNTIQLCGQNNWRAPSEKELRSLIISKPKPGRAQVDLDYFPYTQKSMYWTSEHNIPLEGIFARYGNGAKAFSFFENTTRVIPYHESCRVRLVSDPKK